MPMYRLFSKYKEMFVNTKQVSNETLANMCFNYKFLYI
jgi:hypothetical protein